ncbi:chitinase [Leuconostoc falkenbergense]|uniref:chitinase n=1 Tax=Leuconostoc falkenbergense TaxID=2766470 RepID=UPI001966E452|nr:chitinase [Leuconostoc falkenbergense]QSB51610.1 chitinase [Leuconostoc falkenbergense]
MMIYTKTITAALALMLGAAPLVGTVSAETSNGTVTFANDAVGLSIDTVDNIEFGTIDLASVSDFTPTATNQGTGKVVLSQTSAEIDGTYSITVKQAGAWTGGSGLAAANLPINYDGTSITSAQNFVNAAAAPARGSHNYMFDDDSKDLTLDLTGSSDLSGVVNESLTSQVTWTLTTSL